MIELHTGTDFEDTTMRKSGFISCTRENNLSDNIDFDRQL